jgi:hypothetical protein
MTMAAAHGLEGGILIGLAAMLLWLGIGRIAGVSGIAFGLVRERHERGWRVAFVLALILGAALARVGFGARGSSTAWFRCRCLRSRVSWSATARASATAAPAATASAGSGASRAVRWLR